MNDQNKLKQQFEACMLGGAIGDAWGSCFENVIVPDNDCKYALYKYSRHTFKRT